MRVWPGLNFPVSLVNGVSLAVLGGGRGQGHLSPGVAAVHGVPVALQVRSFDEGFVAGAAVERPLASMLPLVVFQVGLVLEGLFTHLTGEGPLVAVDPLVPLQVGAPDEGLAADHAAVRLEARVDLEVLLEVGGGGEGLRAVLAAVRAVGGEQPLLFGVVVHGLGSRVLTGAVIPMAVQQVLQLHVAGGGGAPAVAVRLFTHVGVVVVWLRHVRAAGAHAVHPLVIEAVLPHLLHGQLLQDGVLSSHAVVTRSLVFPGLHVGQFTFLGAQVIQEIDPQDLTRGHHHIDVLLPHSQPGCVHVIEHLFKYIRADEVQLHYRVILVALFFKELFEVVAAGCQDTAVSPELYVFHHHHHITVLTFHPLLV